MVQKISALIVQPAVDASKYTAGAQDKVAADNAMAASSREVGAAAVDTSAKINQAGDVLARLSRQYVEGYATEQRFTQGLNQLNRGLEAGKISIEGAERILVGMNQRLGLTADATQIAAKGQVVLASAVERANAQIARQAAELATADAANRRFQAANSNTISAGTRRAAGFNAGQQLQDIAMMSLLGQSPGALALQQGPQLATAIQQGGGLAALGAGLGSLLSLTTLLTIGLTAAGAATIQWFMKGREGAKSLEEILKGHSDTLGRLKQQYGELGQASKSIGTAGGLAYTEAQARGDVDTLRAAIRAQSGDLSKEFIGGGFLRSGMFGSNTGGLDDLLSTRNSPFQAAVDGLLTSIRNGNGGLEKFDGNLNRIFDDLRRRADDPAKLAEEMRRLSDAAVDAFAVTGKYSPFQDEVDRLLIGLKEGNSDLSTFATNVRRIGEMNGIGKQSDDAILAAKEVVGLAEKLREVEQILRRIDQENTRPGLRDQRDLRRYVAGRDADARYLDQQFAADQQLARARTNAERLVAIETQVRARAKEDGDSGGGLRARVDRALAEERTRQEVEARDAAIQRSQAIERSLEQQRLELDLIGRTGGEQAKLTFQFERMQELRERAARTGEPIDQKEVALIEAAASAMGKYVDTLAQARLHNDLAFDMRQLGRSDLDQRIAGTLKQYGLREDLSSYEAGLIRTNLLLQQHRDEWESIRDIGRSAIDDLLDPTKWDDFGDVAKGVLMDILGEMSKLAVNNPLKNMLYGDNLPTLDSMGGIGGVLGTLFGAPFSAISGGRISDVTMTAGTVVVNGSIAGGLGNLFGLSDKSGKTISFGDLIGATGAANDNSIVRQALGAVSTYGNDLASNIRLLASNIGASAEDVGTLISFESGFRPQIMGGSGGKYRGLIQMGPWEQSHYGLNANTSLPDQFGMIEQFFKDRGFKPGMSGLDLYSTVNAGSPGRYNASDAANGGTWGTVADKWNQQMGTHRIRAQELLGESSSKASTAINQMTSQAADASKGLDTFGGGLNTFGKNLANAFPAAPSGGGGGGLLGSIFGGLFGGFAHPSWDSLSSIAQGDILGGPGGLYAKGGAFMAGNVIPFANGDVLTRPTHFPMSGGRVGLMGEAGPEAIMPLRRGADGRLGVSMVGGGQGAGGSSNVHVTVGVTVDRNGNLQAFVKDIAQGEAAKSTREGLSAFNRQLPDRVAQIRADPRAR